MSSQQAPDSSEQAQLPYSQIAAAHIRELSNLNQNIPDVLRKSAIVISLLTNNPVAQSRPIDTPTARTEIINSTSYELFLLLNTIRTHLHNQIKDLESEKVIPAEATRFIAQTQIRTDIAGVSEQEKAHAEQMKNAAQAGVTNGGLGNLDIAELNARAGVGQQGDEEVIERVQGILKELIQRADNEGENMVVDG